MIFYVQFVFFFALIVLIYGIHFDVTHLQALPIVPPNASIEYLVRTNVLDHMEWGCLFNTQQPHHSINKWHDLEVNHSEAMKDEAFLTGTTFWVNEHMSVGHAMYDIALIQALQSTKIDRIVLQRAPCMNADLCMGIGTFDSFYKGMYMSMIDAFQPGIPIFVRWTWQEKDMKPLYISTRDPDGYQSPPKDQVHRNIFLTHMKCFERLLRRNTRCMGCFYPGISADAVQKFKAQAYSMLPKSASGGAPPNYFESSAPIVITHVYRDVFNGQEVSRRIANTQFMREKLENAFGSELTKYRLRFVNSSNYTRGFVEQMHLMATSNIVLTEHGAFQSNMMYLRNGSYLIDLRGNYTHGEFLNFEHMAQMFGVFYDHVVTGGLESHRDSGFNVSASEMDQAIGYMKQYISEKPYEFNSK